MKLDVGCGRRKKEGYVGLDKRSLPGVDVVADVTEGIPFSDNTFDEVLCNHSLGHVDKDNFLYVIEEIWRVTKPTGTVRVVGPYYTSKDAYSDPTIKVPFTEHTFRYFTDDYTYNYYSDARFDIEDVTLYYQNPLWKYNPFRRILRHFLMNVVSSIEFELVPVKE